MRELDNKKKIELTITGMGIIFLIFMAISQMPKHKNNKPVSGREAFSNQESAATSFTNDDQGESLATIEGANDAKWGSDPFFMDSNNAIEQGMGELILNGIVSDKDSPYAIINNEIVKLGDKVSGMTVIEINEKNVVLDGNGQRHALELNVY